VATLALDLDVPLRRFALRLALDVDPGTVALVGPSGAGKSTVLRAVAGLHRPVAGRVALGDDVWFDADRGVNRPPERRSVGYVPQELALFPHLTVAQNVGFGGAARAAELLGRMRIDHLADQRPGRLSGGERQRVALARALARDPGVLLLDEPLSALDAETRAVVRGELHDVLAGLGLPALLVTHDAEDAAALAERLGVVVDGRLRQLGPPAELREHPADAFVVRLLGGSVLPARAEPDPRGAGALVRPDAGGPALATSEPLRGAVGIAVHPWEPRLVGPGDGALPEVVAGLEPRGDRVRVRLGALVVERPADEVARLGLRRGEQVGVVLPAPPRTVPLTGVSQGNRLP
jgi:ABC-type sulfate/molybdate transport systems ATPase subunit